MKTANRRNFIPLVGGPCDGEEWPVKKSRIYWRNFDRERVSYLGVVSMAYYWEYRLTKDADGDPVYVYVGEVIS